ncbi:MAG: hypothetical protein FWG84_02380 [Bacteroidales bacterium]|nr:hypothetical protein [Bacteroidales bacterium]
MANPYEYYNGTMGIQARFLFEERPGKPQFKESLCLVGYFTFYRMVRSGRITLLRKQGPWQPMLVKWDGIPDDWQRGCIAAFGMPERKVAENRVERFIAYDSVAEEVFRDYRLPGNVRLTPEKQREYYANAVVLNALRVAVADMRGAQRALGGKTGVWDKLTEAVKSLNKERYPHTLPGTERRLKEKLREFQGTNYEILVNKNFGNTCSAKVNTDTKSSVMLELISDPRNLNNEQVARLYNMIAERMDWKKISAATVGVWRDKYDLESTPGRRGVTHHRNTRAMQVKRDRPTYPMYYWTIDGWDAELLYQATGIDKKGHSVTTYHNRLAIVVVLDPCINYPVGYAIGTHETPELITEALRNAANHTAELFGVRHRTHQLQSDHYAIKSLSPVYEMVAKHFTPAAIKNAKSKVVEPYFDHINTEYCQFFPNWSGFGATARKENQPNVDVLNKHRHEFPDREGCRKQLERIMDMERKHRLQRYMELYGRMPAEDKLLLSTEDYLYYFGASTQKNRLEAQGLTPTILGVERFYDSFDLDFRRHGSVRWTVKYDPEDLSQALAVNDDGTLRFMLQEKYSQPMALKERKEGDAAKLQAIFNFNIGMEEYITEVRARSYERVQQLFTESPTLNDTLAKMVLVDSHGQHKDQRNSQRLLASPTLSSPNLSKGRELVRTRASYSLRNEWEQEDTFASERREYVKSKVDLSKYLVETI